MGETAANLSEFIGWKDLVDILGVAILAYYLLLLIRGTRAVQVLLGILFLVAISYLAGFFQLDTLRATLENFTLFLPLAVIILFRSEIRSALASFGMNPLLGLAAQKKVQESFHEIVLASTTLASRQVGGLIVVERYEGLRDYVENGINLDAVVSFDLLLSIFNPQSPLHDGAVIVQQGRIAAAACFLPLSRNPELSNRYGTRHRAALGITEETDALAVVVSEETATISVAFRGEMMEGLDGRALRNTLYKYLVSEFEQRVGASA